MDKALLSVLLVDGLVWVRSGFEKLTDPKFVGGLGGTLAKFASKNPYQWYAHFLTTVAIPNAGVYAQLTQWGEMLTGISIVSASLYLLFSHWGNKRDKGNRRERYMMFLLLCGLIGGAFLNLQFWLASGWLSSSTDTLNLLMMAIELVGATAVFLRLKIKT